MYHLLLDFCNEGADKQIYGQIQLQLLTSPHAAPLLLAKYLLPPNNQGWALLQMNEVYKK